jgi:hypothetical protein
MKADDWTYTRRGKHALPVFQPAASKRYTRGALLWSKKISRCRQWRYTTEEESFDRAHPAAAYAAASITVTALLLRTQTSPIFRD